VDSNRNLSEKEERLLARSNELMHAIQSGIAYNMQLDPNGETSAKHLRVGVNNALIQHAALIRVLCDSHVILLEKYLEVYVALLEDEKKSYEAQLTTMYGRNIKLL
jgi:hypothetical protein